MYCFTELNIKVGFSYNTDFFQGGQLHFDGIFHSGQAIVDKVQAKAQLRCNLIESQFDYFFKTSQQREENLKIDG